MTDKPIIHMEGIEKHFGNVIALAGVSFDVRAGECHCLLGDNGTDIQQQDAHTRRFNHIGYG